MLEKGMAKLHSFTRVWTRPLADLVGGVIDPVLARQGFADSGLILCWEEIVGPRLAAVSEPLKLQWPTRGTMQGAKRNLDSPPDPATLVVRVESGFALELQHLSSIVIERVNTHFGWRCIGRVTLKQGPLGRHGERKKTAPAPSAEAVHAAERLTSEVTEEALRQALIRLGARILSSPAATP